MAAVRRLRSQSSECGNLFTPHGDVSRSHLLPGHADRVGPREGRPVVAPAQEALELLDLPLARHLDRVRVEGRRVGARRSGFAVGITKGLGVGVGVGVRVAVMVGVRAIGPGSGLGLGSGRGLGSGLGLG